MISAYRYLATKLKTIINSVIQRNSYFAHPKNLFLAMLTDSQKTYSRISCPSYFESYIKTNKTRLYKFPNINRNVSSYIDLIDLQQNITEPLILKIIYNANIQLLVKQKKAGDISLLRLPCHTQVVKRTVKTVTEASSILCSKYEKKGFIKA